MGLTVDYTHDCKVVVGAYIEVRIDANITNDTVERRQQSLLGKLLTFYHIPTCC